MDGVFILIQIQYVVGLYIIIDQHVHTFLQVLYKSDVDVFADPPSYPSILITVSAEHGPDTMAEINYSVPLRGINPINKKIYIIRSLRHGKQSIILDIVMFF